MAPFPAPSSMFPAGVAKILRQPRFLYVLAFALGALGALAFTPWDGFWLALLVWAGLYALLIRIRSAGGTPGWLGLVFGLGFFGVGASWVYVSLHDNAAMAASLALLATGLFCLLLAAFHGLAAVLWSWLRSGFFLTSTGGASLPDALLFGVLWGLTDWLRGWVLTGFPWLALGYSQLPAHSAWNPLAGYFPLLGVYGVGLLTAFSAALLLCGRRGLGGLVVICLGGAGLQLVTWTQPVHAPVPLALVQGNIPQDLKWDPVKYEETLSIYARLTAAALEQPVRPEVSARLVILPETAFPAFLQDLPPGYRAWLEHLLDRHSATLLAGVVTGDGRHYFNSAVVLGERTGEGGQAYHKVHLVPFGEFIPEGFGMFLKWASIPMSGFTSGSDAQRPLQLAGVPMALNICYEDVFGEALRSAAGPARLLVNLSNTAWFGDSLAQPQHLQIARVRAVETGKPVVRATNTGMTAVIRPSGDVEAVLPPFREGILRAEVQGYSGETPYVRWGNQAFLLLAGSCLLNLLSRRRSQAR